MREAPLFTAQAKAKGTYQLPAEFDGRVNQHTLWTAVRAYLNNQRHGTHSTLTRGLVSGGNQKPWRQKGTGRARQGSIRAPNWPGGGKVFAPLPRSYRTGIQRKVRRGARLSALNARANDGHLYVIEALDFVEPKTKQMAGLLDGLGLGEKRVCLLTAEHRPNVYLSGRNIPNVRVLRYADAPAYDLLWADAVVVEEAALGGKAVAGPAPSTRAKRAAKAAAGAGAKTPAPKKKPAAAKAKAKAGAAKKPKKEGK